MAEIGAGAGAGTRPRIVALGGGHGLFAMLQALRRLDADLTAVVTVADDGGSSGRLRRELPAIVPPGDLRMALAALAGETDEAELWATTLQHRFAGEGALAGHPVGNLVLAGLAEVLGDPVAALDATARLLQARGRVLPMSCRPLTIVAQVERLDADPAAVRTIRGQVAVAATPGRVRSVDLEPRDAAACPEALAAVAAADLVVLGPGSWFTSVLPHLMLPGSAAGLVATAAHRLVVLNLSAQPGETEGFSPEQHLDVLSAHAPAFRIDTVLADSGAVPLPGRLAATTDRLGARLVLADIAVPGESRHDPTALAAAIGPVLARAVSDRAVRGRGRGQA
ncbi:gluconeogenesis factor YvcK family protein [Nakamurella endophytica]|uniref:gluconeogenesis factor YvcK family protein n=1 Tax=Nakamurella endophytica TaxID=1748367 RepID=UPI003571557D